MKKYCKRTCGHCPKSCTAEDTDKDCCSTNNKCGEGQGDCDDDSHCMEGLKCGHVGDYCPEGFPDGDYDCCYKQFASEGGLKS